MFKQLVIIAFLLRFSYSVALENCPLSEKEWRSRGKKMNCKLGLSYHCLMDYSGNSTEFCLTRKEYDKRGCPWVLKRGERYFLGEPFTSCINNTYCPIEGTTYYSDELYEYPACLVKEEERQNFTLSAESPDDKDIIINSSNQNEPNSVSVVAVILVIVLIVLIVIGIAVGCLIWKRIKGKNEKDAGGLSPYKRRIYRIAAWKLKKMIENEDNPQGVEDLYSDLEKMKESYYEDILPVDIEGSFLRYAVKMNRRRTVLFFLQRQKEAQKRVFEEDTYGVDKNQSIIHVAKEKRWNDVVNVLKEIYDPETNNGNNVEQEMHVCTSLLNNDAEVCAETYSIAHLKNMFENVTF